MGKSNGEVSLAAAVAAELNALSSELEENAEEAKIHATQMRGLARVITKQNVVFMDEHAEEVAKVVQVSGDIDHRRGSLKYARAKNIRRAAGK